jgi:hypothetical protein
MLRIHIGTVYGLAGAYSFYFTRKQLEFWNVIQEGVKIEIGQGARFKIPHHSNGSPGIDQ